MLDGTGRQVRVIPSADHTFERLGLTAGGALLFEDFTEDVAEE
ncbi:hypothetical protein XA26_15900 [Mycolicibacterium fortuitum]|uniref:Uncharacterized protein n=1 Tax=Mycolicibacterium fortuitum TaxID=1766 RepID=A0A0N9XGR6_MYCFO|nr:hypothetical protein G155_07990 [Mycobacterium sp. VKM Ac-1817D]ALI25437.1 hypothetical protein XA26_15900 [Mycolicibacterium fortuitum]